MSYVFNFTNTSIANYTPLITSVNAITSSNNNGEDLTISTGLGDGIGNGGNININPSGSTGSGIQGGINFSALGASKILPVNEIGNLVLNNSFIATSIVGALNELKGNDNVNPIQQGSYSSIVDINFNGTTPVIIPDASIDITIGDWLVGYSFVIRTSASPIGIDIYVEGSVSGIISASQCFIRDNTSNNRHVVNREFIINAAADESLQLTFVLVSGTDTSVAIETNVMSGTNNPDQIVVLWGFDVSTLNPTIVEYAGADINYNDANLVDVDTITLTGGTDWIVGYGFTLKTPTASQDVITTIRTTADVEIDQSLTYFHRDTTNIYYDISKSFIISGVVSGTGYKLSFGLDAGTDTGIAVDTAINSIPVIWAIDITGLTFVQTINTSGVDINYNNTNEVAVSNDITISSGVWLVGYSLALHTPSNNDDMLISLIDSSSNKLAISYSFSSSNDNTTSQTISRLFGFLTNTATEDYHLSIRLNNSVNTSLAVDMTYQNPVLFAYRLGDVSVGDSFLSLTDTPDTYAGSGGFYLRVNNAEDAVVFNELAVETGNNNLLVNSSHNLQYGAYTVSDLTTRCLSISQYIYLPPGTFNIVSGLNVLARTIIEGSGESTILNITGAGINFTNLECGIRNLTITRVSPDATASITVSNANSFRIENVHFNADTGTGGHLNISNGIHSIVSNCKFDSTTNTAINFSTTAPVDVIIENCYFTSCVEPINTTNLLRLYTIVNNTFISCGNITLASESGIFDNNYIYLSSSTGDIITITNSEITISNNLINGTTATCAINITSAAEDIIISNNIIKDISAGIGIQCVNTSILSITGNTIQGCDGYSINIVGSATQAVITDNNIRNGNSTAINVEGRCIITGNILTANGSASSESQIVVNANSISVNVEGNTIIPYAANVINDELISVVATGNNDTVHIGTNNAFKSTTSSNYYSYNDIVNYNGTGGAIALNNLTRASAGHRLKISNSTGGNITFTPATTTKLTSLVVNNGGTALLIWNGTYWDIETPLMTSIAPVFTQITSQRTTSANQSAVNGGFILVFNTIVLENGVSYSAGTFTIQYAGLYSLNFSGIIDVSGAVGIRAKLTIDINGLNVARYADSGIYSTDGTIFNFYPSGSVVLKLNVGETVLLNFSATSGSTPTAVFTTGGRINIIRLAGY